MSTPDKKLKDEARKYLSLRDLFPKGAPDLRKKLNKYQAGKIRKAVAEIKKLGAGYPDDIVAMGRGRKKYMAEKGLPPYMKGIFLSGGAEKQRDLKYVAGEVRYKRGISNAERSRVDLYTAGDENDLIADAKEKLKRRKNRRVSITANGRVIVGMGATGMRDNQTIIKEAVYIFLKYSEMYEKGEMRERKLSHGTVRALAAHPKEWGMGILFEKGQEDVKKAKRRKK